MVCKNNQFLKKWIIIELSLTIEIYIAGVKNRAGFATGSQDDVKSLQADLLNLEHWSCVSGFTFNQSKCKHQRIKRKILPVTSSYELGNHLIDTTENEKDLGVWLSSKLTWKKQVYVQTAKANKLLGHISRNTIFIRNTTARRSMYLTLVRPHFCYASQVWAPQTIELLQKLERTQICHSAKI